MNQGQMLNERQLRTPPFRIMWPALVEPRAMEGEPPEKAKYSVVMVWDKSSTDFSLIKALIEAKLPELNGKPVTRTTLHEGIEKAQHGAPFDAGSMYASASSKYKPMIVTASREIATPDQIIQGSYAVAVIHAYKYDWMGNRGISFGLDAVQLLGGGERIVSQVDPASLFEAGVMQPTVLGEDQAITAPPAATGNVPEQW